MMMIGIFAGVPFMGIVGFIVGPVLVALAVTGYKILAEEAENAKDPLPRVDCCVTIVETAKTLNTGTGSDSLPVLCRSSRTIFFLN